MSHRAKHRRAALLRRVEHGRLIKSDLQPDGSLTTEYATAKAESPHAVIRNATFEEAPA